MSNHFRGPAAAPAASSQTSQEIGCQETEKGAKISPESVMSVFFQHDVLMVEIDDSSDESHEADETHDGEE